MSQKSLLRYRDDPILYAREVIGLEVTEDQKKIALSVRDNRYTAAMASHSVGKTVIAAILSNWWYDTRDDAIVYITAPTWDQCLGLTFKQVRRFRLARNLPGHILDSGLVRDQDRLRATGHYIKAINAEKGEGIQGEHTAPMLIVMEEAVGIPPYVWEAVRGLMTDPACRTLAIANPTDEATAFGAATKSKTWKTFRISGLEHPNIAAELAGLPQPFPGAVSLRWIAEMLADETTIVSLPDGDCFSWYRPEALQGALSGTPITSDAPKVWYLPTADFQGRVLGLFPTQADEQVIPRGWLETLPALPPEEHVPTIGCDVARMGKDRTVIVWRIGPHLMDLSVLRQMDNLQVTGALKETAALAARRLGWEPDEAKRVPIRIDVTGGLGTGPYDILREDGYNVVPVNAGSKPSDREQFRNRRSEMWWSTRVRVREKRMDLSHLAPDDRSLVIAELALPKYKVDTAGRKVVEEKDEMKKRLGSSPDVADAVNLCFADVGRWWEDPELSTYLQARHTEPEEAKAASSSASKVPAWLSGVG